MLTKSNKDPNFKLQYLVKNKAQRLPPMEELLALLKDKSNFNQSKNNSDKWKNALNTYKKETAKAMVSIRQSGELTNK